MCGADGGPASAMCASAGRRSASRGSRELATSLGTFHTSYNFTVICIPKPCPVNIHTCANRISMRLIFDLHARVRILKSLSCNPRTRVNIDRAGLGIIKGGNRRPPNRSAYRGAHLFIDHGKGKIPIFCFEFR